MNIMVSGFERPWVVSAEKVTVVEILDKHYASRVVSSLVSEKGEEAIEPYIISDEKNPSLKPSVLLVVPSVFDLPWGSRAIVNGQLETVRDAILHSSEARDAIDSLASKLRNEFYHVMFQFGSNYDLSNDWDAVKYLKAFGFGVEKDPEATLFENVKHFLLMLADIGLGKTLVFIGFKQFFTEKELFELYNLVISLKLSLVSIETCHDDTQYEQEVKVTIDQDLLEI